MKITDKLAATNHAYNKKNFIDPGEIYFNLLFGKPNWVKRVNESIIFNASDKVTQRKVSLDVEIPEKIPAFKYIEKIASKDDQIALPVGILGKEPILKFDISLNGQSIPHLTSSENGRYTRLLIKYFIEELYSKLKMKYEIPEDFLKNLFSIADDAVSYDGSEREMLRLQNNKKIKLRKNDYYNKVFLAKIESRIKSLRNSIEPTGDSSYDSEINKIFNQYNVIIKTIALNFIIFCLISGDHIGTRQIVKYSILNPDGISTNPRDLGYIKYSLIKFWRETTHHVYVELPEGLRLVSMTQSERKYDFVKEKSNYYKELSSPNSKLINDWSDFEIYDLCFYAIPEKIGIRRWSSLATTVVLFFIIISAFYLHTDLLKPNLDSMTYTTSAAILTSSSTMLLAWLARGSEHPIYQTVIAPLRTNLALLSFILLLVTIELTIPLAPLPGAILWGIIYVMIVTVSLRRFFLWHNCYYFPDKNIS